jgi:AcrR family transcriptional regulator
MSRRRRTRGEGRARLLGAAAECYGRGGRRGITLNQVCAQAEASVGAVYHHFPGGLRELEDALYLDTLASYHRGLLRELQHHDSAREGVKAVVFFHLEWMADNVALAQYLLSFSASLLSSQHLAQLETMNADFAKALVEWRDPHVAAGRIRRLPLMLYWSIILGPAQQYGSEIIAKADVEEVAANLVRAAPTLAEAAWLAVRGDEGASGSAGAEGAYAGPADSSSPLES